MSIGQRYTIENFDRGSYSLGKNGYMITTGVEIFESTDVIEVSPINSKGKVGICYIQIPKNKIQELIDALKQIKDA